MSTPEKEFVLTQIYENVEKIGYKRVLGTSEQHFNATWQVMFYRRNQNFQLEILCDERKSEEDVQGDVEFKLESPSGRSLILKRKMILGDQEWTKLMDWNTFLEHYVVNGKVTISARVSIQKMIGFKKVDLRKFDESVKECSDFVIVVSGRRFYVSKMFLAFQSPHFKSHFLENPEITEIELDEIDADDFQNFLELLHGESSIDDFTVDGILNVATGYKSPTALHRCEDFLREKSTKSLGKKLELAARYHLESLKKKYLSEITNSETLKSIINTNLENLDASILKELLRKATVILDTKTEDQNWSLLESILEYLNFGFFFRSLQKNLRNFDQDESCSDVVIVVGRKKFYSSKMFLAMQSSFFKSLLLGKFSESEKSEIELKEIDAWDFQNFLELLHGESSIDDSTVEGILDLSDMYDSATARRRCESFLEEESKISVGKKLELSSRYNLVNLKKKCLSEINNFNDVEPIIKYNMEKLDESILRTLLKTCFN